MNTLVLQLNLDILLSNKIRLQIRFLSFNDSSFILNNYRVIKLLIGMQDDKNIQPTFYL